MFLPPSRQRAKTRIFTLCVALFLAWNVFDVRTTYNAVHSKASSSRSNRSAASERVFISSLHFNNANLLRSHWTNAILDLSRALGPSNVYFSAYESGSTDDTRTALTELDAKLEELGVARTIILDGWTHAEEMAAATDDSGWLETPNGGIEYRRIPFLARLRNLSLRPLERLVGDGHVFERVVFLNDVVFQAEDVVQVLETNGGDYAAACALDFDKPPEFYDTFALFDTRGDQYWTRVWPYFRSSVSRTPMIRKEPVPVKSCWNGIAAFDARPFMDSTTPLRFRAIPDSLAQLHVEASECCLIHADNPLSNSKGVWLNPNVRVAYTAPSYDVVQKLTDQLTPAGIFKALWYNRVRRWAMIPFSSPRDWAVAPRLRGWELDALANREPGAFCLSNEMQVLTPEGWTHVSQSDWRG